MMKRFVSLVLTLVLCLTLAPQALAAGGNRALLHNAPSAEGVLESYINGALETEEGIYVFLYGTKSKVLFYAGGEGEPLEYEIPESNVMPEVSEEGSYVYENSLGWFAWNGGVYQLFNRNISHGETSEVEGGLTKKLVLEDGKLNMAESDLPQLDWTDMIEDYGSWKSSRYLSGLMVMGDRLMGISYDENGNSVLMIFDLTTGYSSSLEMQDSDMSGVAPFGENDLILIRYERGNETTARVIRLNLEDESEEELSSRVITSGQLVAVCPDPATNTLYYVDNGEIWAAPDMDLNAAVAVNDCPLSYDVNMRMMKDGNLLLYGQNAVMIRSTDPSLRADYSLVVSDTAYSSALRDAMFTFNDATGVPVIMQNQNSADGILQAMMNRDDQVDVYCLQADASEFDAMRNRGFLYDLSGNEKLRSTVERMVPYVKDAVMRDGKLVAVPLNLYGSTLGYKPEVLKQLGEGEELPKTWNAFFDWLQVLPGKMEGKGLSVFSQYMGRWEFRYSLLSLMLDQYQLYVSESGGNYAFNTPVLRGLLERLAAVDCDALGLKENEDEENGGMWSEEDYRESLIESYASVSLQTYNEDLTPLLLSFEEGQEARLPVTLTVAFVNPFSKHPEEAVAYLADALDHMETGARYSFFTDMTEPVRYPGFEEYKESLQDSLEEAKRMLETAEDDNKEMIEESIANLEKNLAEVDETYYMISPENIAGYQARIPYIRVQTFNLASAMRQSEGTEGGDYYSLVDGYANGLVTAEELLTTIDRKVQVMLREGN